MAELSDVRKAIVAVDRGGKLSIPKRSKMGGAHGPAGAERLQRPAGSSPGRECAQRQGSEISEKPPKLRLELQRRVPD